MFKTGSLAVCSSRDEMQFLSAPRVSNHATSQMFMPFDTCFAFTLPIQQSTYRILWPEISLGALTQKEMPWEKRTESASIICYLASGYDFMDFHISAPKRHNNPKDFGSRRYGIHSKKVKCTLKALMQCMLHAYI